MERTCNQARDAGELLKVPGTPDTRGEILAMPTDIGVDEVQRLIESGAQLVEVLPAQEYEEEHVPGAINIPLKTLDNESAASLDRDRAVVVYCWDDA
jgi:hypothetical protein